MDPRIKTILEYAIMAPSGDNCQPWRFTVDDRQIELYNDPDADDSLYNLKQRASLIAHGALLENIRLAAPAVGLDATIKEFPTPDNPDHIATLNLVDGPSEEASLFKAIPQRHTNRERYEAVKISDSQIQQWQELSIQNGDSIWIGHQPEQIKQLAGLLSLNDKLVFSVPDLHRFLFEQIRWNDTQARQTGDGLDIKTLGLNAMDKQAFRFLKNWPLIALLNKVGFSNIIQLKAKQTVNSASAIAVLAIPGSQPIDYLRGGMLWQRLQLQLAAEGLTSQPIAGLACLMQSQAEGALAGKLSEEQQDAVKKTRVELQKIAGFDKSSVILTMFRIGKGRDVTRALRRPVESFLRS